jgi:signal transduction histidine kinase
MNLESLSDKIYSRPQLRIGAHLLFWLCELVIFWYTTIISFNTYKNMGNRLIWELSIANTLNLALFYYPLVYLLIPQLKKKRYLIGIAGIVGLLLFYSLINALAEKLLLLRCDPCMLLLKVSNNDYYQFLQRNLPNRLLAKVATFGIMIGLIFSISVPLAIKIALQSFRQQMAAIKLAKENVELEFNFLKSQVNPHFLFNSLNNIYGLILKNENVIAAETVARLAEFMRYTLHSSDSDRMPLQKELQLLRDYIDLEKIRLNHTVVTFDLDPGQENPVLPSLLLVPMIENAFKYSADQLGATISIRLHISGNKLELKVTNTIDENRRLNAAGGIGLQNLTKRLNLYYPGNYNYKVTDTGWLYITKLEINL